MTGAAALRLSVVTIIAASFSSCANPHSPWYDPPPGLTSATGATVNMSQNPETPSGPDGDTRVVTVDGQPVSALDFDKIVLPPGDHELGVEYNGLAAEATVPVKATLHAGEIYEVKGQKDGPCDANVWLQDLSTDQMAGTKLGTHLTAKPAISGAPVFAVACD
jgi:hypothetical protein